MAKMQSVEDLRKYLLSQTLAKVETFFSQVFKVLTR